MNLSQALNSWTYNLFGETTTKILNKTTLYQNFHRFFVHVLNQGRRLAMISRCMTYPSIYKTIQLVRHYATNSRCRLDLSCNSGEQILLIFNKEVWKLSYRKRIIWLKNCCRHSRSAAKPRFLLDISKPLIRWFQNYYQD